MDGNEKTFDKLRKNIILAGLQANEPEEKERKRQL